MHPRRLGVLSGFSVGRWDHPDVLNDHAPLPELLALHIPTREALLGHEVTVDGKIWRELTAELGLPEPGETLASRHHVSLTRGQVFQLADTPISPGAAMQLFYASTAWGLGRKARNLRGRLQGLTDAQAQQRLVDAWRAVREGRRPEQCYELLVNPKGAGLIHYFGPAFATKFLYFAIGTRPSPRCLILDAVVAEKIRPFAWPDSPTAGWWPSTYGRYCDLLGRWAAESGSDDHSVRPDQLEMAIFSL